MYPTPRLTARQPPTDSPTCGHNLPSLPGAVCADPAVWHVRWERGDGVTARAALYCGTHMDHHAQHHTWYGRHPARPACTARPTAWGEHECTQPPAKERS